ncbi:MAG: acetylornithine/succinylornithine family transaminase [Lachnospiraceae bacterium]|nr:acetylornithine/succinylornithine family transaminase [Lachnospiraceae bacterium]
MTAEQWKEQDKQYIAGTYARFPIIAEKGEGAVLTDIDGKQYIDLGAGIGVTAFGYLDPEWKKAVLEQLEKIQHTSNLYYTQPCITLAKMLCERTGMSKVFFSNSGAEANECAIKAARKYAVQKKGAEYTTIITLKESFHGRTLTTLAATGQVHYHEQFQPLTTGFVHGDASDIEQVKGLIRNEKVAGILIECVQGEGGVNVLDKEFVQEIARICAQEDIVLLIDEVQTGNGRTGKLYSYMHYGIKPDVVSTAKGLGGGLPIGATMLSEKLQDVFAPGDNGSTFGANPVICAGAVSIISRLDDDFLEQVVKKGDMIRAFLCDKPGILGVDGLGMMIGVRTERKAIEIVKEGMEAGILCLTAKDKVRLLPPLNIPEADLKRGLEILAEICGRTDKND